jgi:hypothetical protein
MISKCANPDCGAPFRYLREGKLFRVELDTLENPPVPGDLDRPWHRVEHFWLCGRCAGELTLVCDKERGIMAVPLAKMPKAS